MIEAIVIGNRVSDDGRTVTVSIKTRTGEKFDLDLPARKARGYYPTRLINLKPILRPQLDCVDDDDAVVGE